MERDVSKWNKLIQHEDFKWTLKSILDIGDSDSEWKADLIQFLNSDTNDGQSSFYYDMLPMVRFIADRNAVAYTTPDHKIFMSAPTGGGVGKNEPGWEFIYFHECLHQLWDTFDVKKNIERQFGSCDRQLLNIASDCVINDFLHFYRKMNYPTKGLITPELILSKYGVKYDRTKDTQFGLYEKLMKVSDQIKKDPPEDKLGQDQNQGQGKGKGQGQGKSQNQSQGQGQGNGNDQGQGQGNGQNQDQGNQSGSGSGNYNNFTGVQPMGNEPTSDYFEKFGDKILKKYAGKLSGSFGEFIKKCKTSKVETKKEGMVVRQRGGAKWDKMLEKRLDSYVNQKVQQKKREMEQTYSRMKRGTRPVKFGQPIQPGTKVKDDKLNITVAFYVDCSGSMGSMVDNVLSLAYQLSDKIIKEYGGEKVVGDVKFDYYAFNDAMREIKKGAKIGSSGGTMSLDKLLDSVKTNTSGYLINIIITDAEFYIDGKLVKDLVNSMDGMFFLIANRDKPECKDIEKVLKGKFVFIEADKDFKLS